MTHESDYVGDPKMGKALRKVGFRSMGQAKQAARVRRGQVRLDKLPRKVRKRLLDPKRKDILLDKQVAEAKIPRSARSAAERIRAALEDGDQDLANRIWELYVYGGALGEPGMWGYDDRRATIRFTKMMNLGLGIRGPNVVVLDEALDETNGGGDCYEAAANYMMEHGTLGSPLLRGGREGNPDLILVHGEVTGQGPIAGLKYGHAWVEDGETVIDKSNGRDLRMPKVLYYALAQIDHRPEHQNIHRYTAEEARRKLIEYQHYGPWDLKTSSGL